MRHRSGWTTALSVGVTLALSPLTSGLAQSRPTMKEVARALVTASANIREGERVLIFGSPRDMELLGDIAIEVMKAGGQALISVWTDTLGRRSFDEVPERYDSLAPALNIGLINTFDTQIAVDIGESEDLFAGVPPSRFVARNAAAAPATEAFRNRGVRLVSLGNGLYPTPTLARRLGVSITELEANFWRGVGSTTVQANGEKLRQAFAAGTTVSITHPNGTNLTFQAKGRPVAISDGTLKHGPATPGVAPLTWLPAGEFQIAPVPGTAEGKIVVDRLLWNGVTITGLTLDVSKGKVVQMSASSNLQGLKQRYDAAGPGKDVFASIDIGFNPDISLPLNTGAIVWMSAGAVAFFVGDNTLIGGENHSEFSFSAQQGGTTVRIDGKPIILNGRLQ